MALLASSMTQSAAICAFAGSSAEAQVRLECLRVRSFLESRSFRQGETLDPAEEMVEQQELFICASQSQANVFCGVFGELAGGKLGAR